MAVVQEEGRLGEELDTVGAEAVHQRHRRAVPPRGEPSAEQQPVGGPELDLLEARKRMPCLSAVLVGQAAALRVEVAASGGHRAPANPAGDQRSQPHEKEGTTPVANSHPATGLSDCRGR